MHFSKVYGEKSDSSIFILLAVKLQSVLDNEERNVVNVVHRGSD